MPVLVALCQTSGDRCASRVLEEVLPRVLWGSCGRARPPAGDIAGPQGAAKIPPSFLGVHARRRLAGRGWHPRGNKDRVSLTASLALVDVAAERGQRPSSARCLGCHGVMPKPASSPAGINRTTTRHRARAPRWPVCPGPRKGCGLDSRGPSEQTRRHLRSRQHALAADAKNCAANQLIRAMLL